MPWKSNDPPDPLKDRRKQLEAQQRLLAEQRQRLTEELRGGAPAKPVEPPVWRMEDEPLPLRAADPTPARKRNLARQRRRDRLLFFLLIVVLIVVGSILLWVAYVHNTASINGT